MLEIRDMTKVYSSGELRVEALRGINLQFGESEFAAILGPSGCGKTTLLNLIGGLDQYTAGDLLVRGRSTKEYTDRDWDAYRNHSVGFVFQSYNLIPHQSVLANVELALTLSGVGREERRRRAIEALEKVGLGDQLKKKPNQMSGGQMQRVSIARALVNNPDILLADEPTGALDSETSVQVMEILREISREKLVIMVTHNPELANRYATRIIRLLDGRVISDTANTAGKTEAGAERKAGTARAPLFLSRRSCPRKDGGSAPLLCNKMQRQTLPGSAPPENGTVSRRPPPCCRYPVFRLHSPRRSTPAGTRSSASGAPRPPQGPQ